jgi:hypothetical protein
VQIILDVCNNNVNITRLINILTKSEFVYIYLLLCSCTCCLRSDMIIFSYLRIYKVHMYSNVHILHDCWLSVTRKRKAKCLLWICFWPCIGRISPELGLLVTMYEDDILIFLSINSCYYFFATNYGTVAG